MDQELDHSGFESHLCNSQAVWSWPSPLTTLNVHPMLIIIRPIFQVCHRNQANAQKHGVGPKVQGTGKLLYAPSITLPLYRLGSRAPVLPHKVTWHQEDLRIPHSCPPPHFVSQFRYFFLFFKKILFIFRERKGERKKHQCVVASQGPPTEGLACNPSLCPDWELNQWPFSSQASAQSTEPHQPGHFLKVKHSPWFWK